MILTMREHSKISQFLLRSPEAATENAYGKLHNLKH
jgi:hypothetical protein